MTNRCNQSDKSIIGVDMEPRNMKRKIRYEKPTTYSLGRCHGEPVFCLLIVSDFFLTFLVSKKKVGT